MQIGRGGMGSHKHGVSGHATKNTRQKQRDTMAFNRERDEFERKKANLKPKMFASVQEALANYKYK